MDFWKKGEETKPERGSPEQADPTFRKFLLVSTRTYKFLYILSLTSSLLYPVNKINTEVILFGYLE